MSALYFTVLFSIMNLLFLNCFLCVGSFYSDCLFILYYHLSIYSQLFFLIQWMFWMLYGWFERKTKIHNVVNLNLQWFLDSHLNEVEVDFSIKKRVHTEKGWITICSIFRLITTFFDKVYQIFIHSERFSFAFFLISLY